MNFGPYSFKPSNLDKVLFPKDGITKGDLINYYVQVAGFLLRHAKGRPVAMHRFPNGIDQQGFLQKDIPAYFPDWIKTVQVKRTEGSIRMLTANNAATLAFLADQACIEPHLFPGRTGNLTHPDKMIFDLDPPVRNFSLVIKAARALRLQLEEEHNLPAFIMTTGSKGMHVVTPLRPESTYDQVRNYARQLCEELAAAYPDEFTTEVRKDKRNGRLFLDYLRNAYGQHSIAPYGLRALPGAPVATPLDWTEIGQLPKGAQSFGLHNILQRLEDKGDPWKEIRRHARKIPA